MTDRLPNAQFAVIDRRKITSYLLARSHPVGRGKSLFFRSFGFTPGAPRALRDALIQHARSAPVAAVRDTAFGRKYILEGPLLAPDGRTPRVRAVWFIETGDMAPRFVTAYPLPGTPP